MKPQVRKNRRWFLAALGFTIILSAAMLRLGDSRSQVVLAFERDRAAFEAAARQVLEYGNTVAVVRPDGVREMELWVGSYPAEVTVEFLFGTSGWGSSTRYWGINYVPGGQVVCFRGTRMEYWERKGNGILFYDPEGDNTCYVEQLDDSWYYFDMRF